VLLGTSRFASLLGFSGERTTVPCLVYSAKALASRLSARVSGVRDAPISKLIVDGIWLDVVEGALVSGERLPTARQVAVELGVSPRSVEQAYRELAARGVVATRPGEGTFISLRPPSAEERARHRRFAELCSETYSRARRLGFSVEELIDALAEFRSIERSEPK
jgi:GntR family transcriptional regulator